LGSRAHFLGNRGLLGKAAAQADLVEVVHTLRGVVCVKG
jgi:hypothetical protein